MHKRPFVKFGGKLPSRGVFVVPLGIRRANSFRRCRTSRPIYCLTILIGTWEALFLRRKRGCRKKSLLISLFGNQSSREKTPSRSEPVFMILLSSKKGLFWNALIDLIIWWNLTLLNSVFADLIIPLSVFLNFKSNEKATDFLWNTKTCHLLFLRVFDASLIDPACEKLLRVVLRETRKK